MVDYIFLTVIAGFSISVGLIYWCLKSAVSRKREISAYRPKVELFPETQEANMHKGEERRSQRRAEEAYRAVG